jgi:hypothetical protein
MTELIILFFCWYAIVGYGMHLGSTMVGDWLEVYYP